MATRREFSKLELSELNSKDNLHLLIHGKVYDVHEFVNEHPGGDLVLFGEAGGDATKAWEDVNHSDDAKTLMKDYLVGYSPEASSQPETDGQTAMRGKPGTVTSSRLANLSVLLLLPFLALLFGLYGRYWLFNQEHSH